MSKRILVVDDSSMMRNMIKSMLIKEGHDIVGEAKNGKDGVASYMDLKPDLVTMDITMREMDGFAAAKEILNFDSDAKIIFLSNLDEERYSKDAESIGGKGYINKHKTREIIELIDKL